jgi:coenzyme F420-reducing hydrogenase beta subunit
MAEQQQTDDVRFHKKFGPVIGYYRAKAKNPEISAAGASGGAATALLLHLLESKAVDCVVVPVFKKGVVEPVITDDPSVVLSTQGSKYVPVPMARVIADFKNRPRKFAMTCTPCQLAAWKMIERKMPHLKDCLLLSIGLFCGHVQRYEGISCLAHVMGIDYPNNAEFLGWRCGPYPGNTRFRDKSGKLVDKSVYPSYDIFIPYFTLNRCFLCPDGANWLADVVLGDVHSEGIDETIIVCRTKRGMDIIAESVRANRIYLQKEDVKFAEKTVIGVINHAKMLPVLAVTEALTKKGHAVPKFDYPDMFKEYPEYRFMKKYWIARYYLLHLAQRDAILQLLERFPWLLERVGRFLFGFPRTLPGWRYKEFARRGITKSFLGR